MRVLILGAAGMLGHKVWQVAGEHFETWAAVRSPAALPPTLAAQPRIIAGVQAQHHDSLVEAFAVARPDAVVNCVGIVKQAAEGVQSIPSLSINALLPHRLAGLCRVSGARLVHISTDCVFSGNAGKYVESDIADATDLYGRTKLLGEVAGDNSLTLRTSMIGREIISRHGLLEWFLSQQGEVRGFTNAWFSGPTTLELARVIAGVLAKPALSGVFHVSADRINKHDLLLRLKDRYRRQVTVVQDASVQLDRSLDSSRFQAASGWVPPSWDRLIDEMAADPSPYDVWRTA